VFQILDLWVLRFGLEEYILAERIGTLTTTIPCTEVATWQSLDRILDPDSFLLNSAW